MSKPLGSLKKRGPARFANRHRYHEMQLLASRKQRSLVARLNPVDSVE